MKIKLKEKYKSLYAFESEELPDFTIIVGKNGSGKSQLLSNFNKEKKNENFIIEKIDKDKIFSTILNWEVSRPSISGTYESYWSRSVLSRFEEYKALSEEQKDVLEKMLSKKVFDKETLDLFIKNESNQSYIIGLGTIHNGKTIVMNGYEFQRGSEKLKKIFYPLVEARKIQLYRCFFDIHKSIKNLTFENFKNIVIHLYVTNDIYPFWNLGVDDVFNNYLEQRHQNEYLYFLKKEKNIKSNAVSDATFVKNNPAPWVQFNAILKTLNMPFKVEEINYNNFDPRARMPFIFINTNLNEPINIGDVSSGESVILSLIFSYINTVYRNGRVYFPQLFVIDEPDAHLHPEMAALLIKLLNDIFVKEYGIKVIITTHSPSTVALAPEDSIFQMKNGNPTSLKKISKDDALEILTGNLPNLSIGYKSHRQVFVESPYDLEYYQAVYNVLNSKEKYPYKLYFMTHQLGKGDCNQVVHAVENLVSSGMNTCYGIIDWDLNNSSNSNILVHGENNRYSIENYLCDPLYLAMLFIKDNGANDIVKKLEIDIHYNYGTLGLESEERLQEVCNKVVDCIRPQSMKYKSEKETFEFRYVNGKKIIVPIWYVTTQGHEFEKDVIRSFDSLKKRYENDANKLKRDLTNVMLGSINSGLIPVDTKELIDSLAK